jgi:Ca2+-binding RTX toxin-like protein
MTVIVNNVSTFNNESGAAITVLDGDDTLYVLQGVSMVQTNSGFGVFLTGPRNYVHIQGLVSGEGGGIYENAATGDRSFVHVAAGGMVAGGASPAVLLQGPVATLRNDGAISGGGIFTVLIYGDRTSVTNTGSISGLVNSLGFANSATSAILDNSGTISARDDAVGLSGAGSHVVNSGVITGRTGIDVSADGDVDIVNTATGRITGSDPGGTHAAIDVINTPTFRLTNFGLIQGQGQAALQIVADVTTTPGAISTVATVLNAGTIAAAGAAAISLGAGATGGLVTLNLTNQGLIVGRVLLSGRNDFYDGALGRMTGGLAGGAGDDLLIGGNAGDTLAGDSGSDIVTGGGGNDSLIGGTDDDDLDGGDGNDAVRGDAGADTLEGGAGADTLSYANSAAGVLIDLLTGDAQFGDAAGDIFLGFEALRGSLRADTLLGAAGRETIDGGLAGDSVLGQDGADLLFGNGGSDTLDGGNGIDTLRGGTENDLLLGNAGNDTLVGDAGADTLIGGAGVDSLAGGAGNDVFRFTALTDSGVVLGTRDRILDFTQGADTIDLAAIDANAGGGTPNDAFAFIGSAAFSAAGQVRAFAQADGSTRIEVNVNAALAADLSIVVVGSVALQATDFVL